MCVPKKPPPFPGSLHTAKQERLPTLELLDLVSPQLREAFQDKNTVFTGWAKMAFEPCGKEAEYLFFHLLPAFREALRPLQGKKMIPEAEEARPLPKRRLPVPAGMGKPLSSLGKS